MIRIESIHHLPNEKKEARFLVDRVWPRGVHRRTPEIDDWLRTLAPSEKLQRWYRHDVDKRDAFRARYFNELEKKKNAWMPLAKIARGQNVMLLYGAKHPDLSVASILKEFLEFESKAPIFKPHHMKVERTSSTGLTPPPAKVISKRCRTRAVNTYSKARSLKEIK